MDEIDWEQAPEGTTHAFRTGAWRKVTKRAVYTWAHGDWVFMSRSPAAWLRDYVQDGKAQPKPAPKENPLPDGKVWFEHATHWSPEYGGFSFTKHEHYWMGQWRPWGEDNFDWWSKQAGVIERFPESGNPQVKQEQPKKPVGWWS